MLALFVGSARPTGPLQRAIRNLCRPGLSEYDMIRPLNWFHRLAGLIALLFFAAVGALGLPAAAQAADDFLEPEQAFPLDVRAAGPKEVLLTFRTVQGYYLY